MSWLYLVLPFVISLALTPLVGVAARRMGLVAYPREDRWHKRATALLGGVSIYLAALIAACVFGVVTPANAGFLCGATFLFLVGLIDDRVRIQPYTKLFLQMIAAGVAIASGVVLGVPGGMFLAVPLTFLWIVGVTNSFNLLDNIDGLAAGIAAIAGFMLFTTSVLFTPNSLGIFALILTGAALGFLPYNFNPARIFMGDSGSMFLGYSLAVISVAGTKSHATSLLMIILIPVFVLTVPLFDTLFVMIGRKLQGKRIFEGGNDHTSHRLVTFGLSTRHTVFLFYAISIVYGGIALLIARHLTLPLLGIAAFIGAAIMLFLGLYIFEVTTPAKLNKASGQHTILNSFFLYKRRIVELVLDFGFICVAYYAAYFLRFEGAQLGTNLPLLKESILWVIMIKLAVFFFSGMYRGVWRYAGIADLIKGFRVVTISSLSAILFITFVFRFKEYSRKVFVFDWLVLLFLVLGSRVLVRVIAEFFANVLAGSKQVVIVGAGDTGEMIVREIKRNRRLGYVPVGFLDDNRSKKGNEIHGVPVLGGLEMLPAILRERAVERVFVAIPSLSDAQKERIAAECEEGGVRCRFVKGMLDE